MWCEEGALPNPSLKQQVGIGFQTNASLQEAFKGITLPVEAVDDIGPWLDERGLEHVGKERQNWVQGREFLLFADLAVLDTSQQLSKDG